nr:lens fiber membrane intrinsic protein-like [Lytechinus pictus]XP_054763237.1 lens fiber membrane intrinsic protein-like [Lytechinus pictus]
MLRALHDETHRTFFQSLGAFEVISTAATFTGCTVAIIAMLHQQPLAMLVAGFTMLFSGLFMLVGHLMMLTAHQETGDMDNVSLVGQLFKDATSSRYGWSFVVAWISFILCVTAGITDFLVYRNFRKITDELHNTPSRVKYMQRQTPVNIGSTI